MSAAKDEGRAGKGGWFTLLLRFAVGGMFIYLGYQKALAKDPSDFLKVLREYQMFPDDMPVLMNTVAAATPWMEMLLGAMLILGIATRGAALTAFVLLVAFSGAIYMRASGIAVDEQIAFCEVAFDCGCGTGVVNVCRKLTENGALVLASLFVLFSPSERFGLWTRMVRGAPRTA